MSRVLAVVPDLFFAEKIAATARAAGVELIPAPVARAADAARAHGVELVLLDLHAAGDPLAVVRALAADPATSRVTVVGFHSHVDVALREAALAAGVHHVLPRSAFSAKLPEILRGEYPRRTP